MERVILVKYSEISLKGKNRADFERRLVDNIVRATGLSALAGIPTEQVRRIRGRIVITPDSEDAGRWIQSVLGYVFGVHSYVPSARTECAFDAIRDAVLAVYRTDGAGNTLRVNARRAAKDFGMNSQELNEQLGASLLTEFPDASVNLEQPDTTVHVEVHEDRAFVYLGEYEVRGPGGLPVGASGTGLLSLSGGIDSPVAGWLALKRGMTLDALHFESYPFTGKKAQEKVFDLARELSAWKAAPMRVYTVSFADIQKHIAANAPEAYLTVLFRRSMQRIAADIARTRGYGAFVTGESLAQVASQTLENMAVIERAANLFTLRPLVGFDKQETMDIARRIGTYEISIRPYEDCCTVFTPDAPRTKSTAEKLEDIEVRLELAALEQDAAEQVRVFSVTPNAVVQERGS